MGGEAAAAGRSAEVVPTRVKAEGDLRVVALAPRERRRELLASVEGDLRVEALFPRERRPARLASAEPETLAGGGAMGGGSRISRD